MNCENITRSQIVMFKLQNLKLSIKTEPIFNFCTYPKCPCLSFKIYIIYLYPFPTCMFFHDFLKLIMRCVPRFWIFLLTRDRVKEKIHHLMSLKINRCDMVNCRYTNRVAIETMHQENLIRNIKLYVVMHIIYIWACQLFWLA